MRKPNVKRRVSLGTAFTKETRKIMTNRLVGKTCQNCPARTAKHLDHLLGLQFGGTSEIENALFLCTKCHAAKSKSENWMERKFKGKELRQRIDAHVELWSFGQHHVWQGKTIKKYLPIRFTIEGRMRGDTGLLASMNLARSLRDEYDEMDPKKFRKHRLELITLQGEYMDLCDKVPTFAGGTGRRANKLDYSSRMANA